MVQAEDSPVRNGLRKSLAAGGIAARLTPASRGELPQARLVWTSPPPPPVVQARAVSADKLRTERIHIARVVTEAALHHRDPAPRGSVAAPRPLDLPKPDGRSARGARRHGGSPVVQLEKTLSRWTLRGGTVAPQDRPRFCLRACFRRRWVAGQPNCRRPNELEVATALGDLADWLAGMRERPWDTWPNLSALAPARSRSARHGAIQLPFRALLAAISAAR